ncbi:MAG: hypothetical protein ACREBC_03800 [Pyrinomonadaceae bacterium]
MKQQTLITEIVATYQKHGWRLERILLSPKTQANVVGGEIDLLEKAPIQESDIDAMWFSRASHGKREAWELRLVADIQYALFKAFEQSEPEDARAEVRGEMEARMREYVMSCES